MSHLLPESQPDLSLLKSLRESERRLLHRVYVVAIAVCFIYPAYDFATSGIPSLPRVAMSLAVIIILLPLLRRSLHTDSHMPATSIVVVASVSIFLYAWYGRGAYDAIFTVLFVVMLVTRIFLGRGPLILATGTYILGIAAGFFANQLGFYDLVESAYTVDDLALPVLALVITAIILEQVFGNLERLIETNRQQSEALLLYQAELENRVESQTATLRQTNQDLREAKNKAEAASRAKSTFLANMSHELRTPLHAIIGYSELIEEELADGNTDIGKELEQIRKSGFNLLSIITEVLDYSRLESDSMTLHLTTFEINTLVQEIADRMRPLIKKQGLEFNLELLEQEALIYSDRMKIGQILTNLISNAIKFTHHGNIVMQVVLSEWRDRKSVSFSVIDEGVGISEKDRKSLFQPFRQLDNSYSRQYSGTGLGLAISRKYSQVLGGDIEVDSREGQGSIFTVHLPLMYK